MAEHEWTPGPWTVDGPSWNQIVWSSHENRVCFLAHTDGMDDKRDIATGKLIAAAPDLAETLVFLREEMAKRPEIGFTLWIERIDAALSRATGG